MEEKNLHSFILFECIVGVASLVHFLYIIIKTKMTLKNSTELTKINRFPLISKLIILFSFPQLYFWFQESAIINGVTYENIERIVRTLFSICLGLSFYEVRIITREGIIINGKMIEWSEIQLCKWKEGLISTIVLNAVVNYKILRRTGKYQEHFNLKIPNRKDRIVKEILKQHIGDRFIGYTSNDT